MLNPEDIYDDKPMYNSPKERATMEYEQIKNSLTGDEQIKIEFDLMKEEN